MTIVSNPRNFCSGTHRSTPFLDRLGPVKAAGFNSISVWLGDVKGLSPDEVADAMLINGLFISELEVMGNWLPGQETAQGAIADMVRPTRQARMFAQASAFGVGTVSACDLLKVPLATREIAAAFADTCDVAADHGLRVAIEFVPTGAIPDLSHALEVIERADRANGGLMVDTWHFFRSGSSLATLAEVPGDRIFSVQLNDAALVPEADLSLGMMNRLLPGEGEFDLQAFLLAINATGTSAPIGIEVFSARLDALPCDQAVRESADALDRCIALAAPQGGANHKQNKCQRSE